MTTPDFSIINCNLNSAQWIKQSIRSVLRQNSVSIDYIFVDGGSTDGTLKKIQSITSPYKLLQRPAAGTIVPVGTDDRRAAGRVGRRRGMV
jgi:glycosyltransferase involved in cell wall biosynthesis